MYTKHAFIKATNNLLVIMLIMNSIITSTAGIFTTYHCFRSFSLKYFQLEITQNIMDDDKAAFDHTLIVLRYKEKQFNIISVLDA